MRSLVAVSVCLASAACSPAAAPSPPARPAPAATVPESARLPDTVRATRYQLDVEVSASRRAFRGTVAIDVTIAEPTTTIWLHARGLTIESATLRTGGRTIEGEVLDDARDLRGIRFTEAVPAGAATIELRYAGEQSEDGDGLYRVREPDGTWYTFTQFEPIYARRAFPCFDEPQLKVPWRLTLRVPRDEVALANTSIESETVDGDQRVVRFAETPPLPSYLVAFVVGPFDVVDSGAIGRRAAPLRFVVPRGRGGELAWAREITPRIVDLLEDYFDMPQPFGKLDVVARPGGGAMEHPGLIAMPQWLTLIADDDTTLDRRVVYADIMAHELAHYWFGDLVTMAWWDDLWLNESFATWMATKITTALALKDDYVVDTYYDTRRAMSKDELMSAKPLRAPVAGDVDTEAAFDFAITYAKGGAVLAMFEDWLGEHTFREVIRRHVRDHAWGVATGADLLAALDRARPGTGAALATFADRPGVPLVSVALECAGGRPPTLRLTQQRYVPIGSHAGGGAAPWSVPVCARWRAAGSEHRACSLLADPSGTLELAGAPVCPEHVVVNDGARGYYRVRYAPAMTDAVLDVHARLPIVERLMILSDLRALVRSGDSPADAVFAATPALAADRDHRIVAVAAAIAGGLDWQLDEASRPQYRRMIQDVFGARARQLGWRPRPGDGRAELELRKSLLELVADHGEDAELRADALALARAYLVDHAAVAPELRYAVFCVAALTGGEQLFDELAAEVERAATFEDRHLALTSLAYFPEPDLRDRVFARMIDPSTPTDDVQALLYAMRWSRPHRDAFFAFTLEHFTELAARLSDMTKAYLFRATDPFCDDSHIAAAQEFFAPLAPAHPGAELALANSLEDARHCVAQRAHQAPAVASFLAGY